MSKSAWKIVGISVFILLLAGAGVWAWRHSVIKKRAEWSAKTVSKAIDAGDFTTAKSALAAISDPIEREHQEKEIRRAQFKNAIDRRDATEIRQATTTDTANEFSRELLEQADLVLAREALWSRDLDLCTTLVERWKSKSAQPSSWVLMSADLILAQGNRQQALDFLEAATLDGEDDALRHARIALIKAQQPWLAMASIDEGLKKNPRNAELLSFRAQIQEAAGRIADARLDYVAAVLSDPGSPLHRDVLANFQLRIGEPSNAADTWRDAAETTKLGIFSFKAWFWSRICGVPLSRPLPEINPAGWSELLKELKNLPHGAFMTSDLDHALRGIRELSQRPEISWLKVLEDLRNSQWKNAKQRLESGFPRSAESLAPGLATRLLVNIAAVAGSDPRTALAGKELPTLPQEPHPFLREFEAWRKAKSDENEAFTGWLSNPASLVATLFAHGWHGAALDVGGGAGLKPVAGAPEWFDFGYARCLLVRDGSTIARQWIESLAAPSAAVQLTHAEILLTGGAVELGMKKLATLASQDNIHASRAAWSLALAELDRGNAAEAARWVTGNAELLASVAGREILARVALVNAKPDEALRVYRELGDQSTDAMIYLSKNAYAEKNWTEARKWTGALARRFPAEPQFRKNLLQIDEESAKP